MTRRALLAAAAAGVASAQRKNRAPVSKENLVVKLNEAAPVRLSNGVTLLVLEDTRLPIVFTRFQVEGAGAIYSSPPGVADLTAEMLKEGAGGRSGRQIVEAASAAGATISSGTQGGAEVATVEGAGLSSRFDQWLDLMADVLLRPAFPSDEFNSLRQRRLVGIRLHNAQAAIVAEDLIAKVSFGDHPFGLPYPPPESLARLTPEMLAAWHRERYAPANTVISCIGRIKASALAQRMETLLGAWKTAAPKIELPPPPQPAAARRIVLADRPGAVQTELAIGGLSFDRRDPDFFPMSVLSYALGGSSSSRVFRELREEKGYGYNAQSLVSANRFSGFWRLRAGVRTDATADSIALMLAQLKRLCEEPMPPDELAESQRAVVGRFALNLEQPQQVMSLSYLRHRYGFSADYWEHYPAKLSAVTAGEVQAVAQKYMQPDRAHIVAVGDAAKIRGALSKLGRVEAG